MAKTKYLIITKDAKKAISFGNTLLSKCYPSKDIFSELLPELKFYKPSMRKALAGIIQKRYTPDIKFLFDENREKVDHVNTLLDKVQKRDKGNVIYGEIADEIRIIG